MNSSWCRKELRTGFFLGALLGTCMALFTVLLLPFFHIDLPAGIFSHKPVTTNVADLRR